MSIALHSTNQPPVIADLTVALFNILPQLIWDATDRFLAGDFLCRVVKYLQLSSLYASSFVLVGSALDRYTAICHPMSAVTRTVYKPKRVLLLCWGFSIIFGLPQIQIFGLREGPHGYLDCWGLFLQPWGPTAYVIWCSLSLFFIPCLIIATAYTHISLEVWRVYREDKSAPGQLQYRRASRFDLPIRSGKFRPRTHRVGGDFRATKIRTVQMTLVIVIAYILCWSPFFIMQLWAVFDLNAPFEARSGPSDVYTPVLLYLGIKYCREEVTEVEGLPEPCDERHCREMMDLKPFYSHDYLQNWRSSPKPGPWIIAIPWGETRSKKSISPTRGNPSETVSTVPHLFTHSSSEDQQ
ncbi:hypothetical protein Bbelb_260910 [Branchiostoma belcheri]|nr:hypothetical protein Bbelb_260910 [Branchiostoma belcheri]